MELVTNEFAKHFKLKVDTTLLNRIKDGLLSHDSIIPVLKVSDTVISTTNEYLNRNNLLLIQTPQAFLTEKIKKAQKLKDMREANKQLEHTRAKLNEKNKENSEKITQKVLEKGKNTKAPKSVILTTSPLTT